MSVIRLWSAPPCGSLEEGVVVVDIPTHPARVRIRPERKVKPGEVLELPGEVTLTYDGRVNIAGEDFGRITVNAEFVELERAPAPVKWC
jgi:hypothetical protein